MNTSDPASLMYEILRLRGTIDRMASRFNDGEKVFREMSLEMPKFVPAELGLLRTVSWFYVLYYEVGKVNIEFLKEKFSIYNVEQNCEISIHWENTQHLRTFFQHNLYPDKPHDSKIKETCEKWFKNQCATFEPSDEQHWNNCLLGFLKEALNFIEALQECLRYIEQDESYEEILRDWKFRRKRYHPPHQFDELISIVAQDMGRNNLDTVRLRKQFYDKWSKELETKLGTYNFNIEARKLIEHALLNETVSVQPITGNDIMKQFNLQPSRQVGELLKIARTFYNADPYLSRSDLLEKLQPYAENIVVLPKE